MERKTVIKFVKYTLVLLMFFFIIKFLYANINTLNFDEIHFNYFYLGLSVLIYLAHILCNAVIWYFITKQNQCNMGFFETLKVRIFSDFGKYIPGKVFAYGILFYSYDQKAISKKKIMFCSFQELILGTLAAVIIALVSIFFSDIAILHKYNLIFLGLAIICFVIMHPVILKFITNFFLRTFKKESISITSTYSQMLIILGLFLVSWLVFGWAFYFFINSFFQYSINSYFFTTGAFAIAGLIGFVALFAPAGIGVREGILIFILTFIFPAAIATLISLISRIWMTICELLLLGIVFSLTYTKNRKGKIVQ